MAVKFNSKGKEAFARGLMNTPTTNMATVFAGGSGVLGLVLYPTTVAFPSREMPNQASATGLVCWGASTAYTLPTAANNLVLSATFNVTSLVTGTEYQQFGWAVIRYNTTSTARCIITDSIGTGAGSVVVVPQMYHTGASFYCNINLKCI
jgi:hypothetical protein